MVKKVMPDGSRTIYIGSVYEVQKNAGGTVTGTTTYYPAAGAMRVNGVLYYVLGDQLGSARRRLMSPNGRWRHDAASTSRCAGFERRHCW